ncbi:MAG: hypothetical protein CUN55_10075 [Phototrophicales bacterium]|nr:MAG: hypothetical protein CUN55_10075 [Phototrophicales bacterium]
MSIEQLDLILGWAGVVLTLMIFSYILADNVLYRLAVHILVGAAAAYAAIAASVNIIMPWFETTLTGNDTNAATISLGLLPLLLVIFLILKLLPRYAHIGNGGLLFVIGVGTGVALVGTVTGTIIPLANEAGQSLSREEETVNGIILLLSTITTLLYFQYLSRRNPSTGEISNRLPMRSLRYIGQGFISVTLGALYAQAILTSLVVVNNLLRTQVEFLLNQLGG